MIQSFADDSTRDIWNGVNSKAARRLPKGLWPVVRPNVPLRGGARTERQRYGLSLREEPMLPTHRPPTHPGEMLLREFLVPLGVSQIDAARRIEVPFQRLNAIIKGRRAVSADTALRLEALTGWDAQIWLALQAKWDLWHARRARRGRPTVKRLRITAARASR